MFRGHLLKVVVREPYSLRDEMPLSRNNICPSFKNYFSHEAIFTKKSFSLDFVYSTIWRKNLKLLGEELHVSSYKTPYSEMMHFLYNRCKYLIQLESQIKHRLCFPSVFFFKLWTKDFKHVKLITSCSKLSISSMNTRAS